MFIPVRNTASGVFPDHAEKNVALRFFINRFSAALKVFLPANSNPRSFLEIGSSWVSPSWRSDAGSGQADEKRLDQLMLRKSL